MPMETDLPTTVTGRNTEGLSNGNIIAIFFGILGAVFFIITLTVGGGLCRKRILSWLEKRRNSDQADAVPENQSPNHPVELTNRSEGAAELLLHQSPAQIETRTMSAGAPQSEANDSAGSPNQAALNAPSEEADGSAVLDQSSLNHQADSSSELSEGAPGVRDEANVAGGSDNASTAFSGKTVLTDIYFMDLSKQIGSEWKELATRLKFEKAEIDRIIENERLIENRTQHILVCWRQRTQMNDRKKVEALCYALTKCGKIDLSDQLKSDAGLGS